VSSVAGRFHPFLRVCMKKLLLCLLTLSVSIHSAYAAAASVAYSCEQAVEGTCKYFDLSLGAPVRWEPDALICEVTKPGTGMSCTFDATACPSKPGAHEDGHDMEGVALCNSCGGESPFSGSVAAAKCCLLYGHPCYIS
jgi:hypothetical protein